MGPKPHPRGLSVYILRSIRCPQPPKSTYTGQTHLSVFDRLAKHNSGHGAKTTRSMRPLEIYAFVQGFKDRSQACRVESATKQESVRSRPGLSREAARTLGLIRALAKKSWRGKKTKPDPDLLLNVPPGFPQDLLADVPDNVITCIGDIKKED